MVSTGRNFAVAAASALAVGALLLAPSSTNRAAGAGRTLAPAVVIPAPAATPTPSPTGKHQPAAAATTVTVQGSTVNTRYGPVSVRLQTRAGRIISAVATRYPSGGGRTAAINARAIPALEAETLSAQSARIDTVSGATYTSEGYQRSLQSALDAAHLG
ncbi:MAG TPA: FMN-binding protein [Sporichthyaceae bacterium]|jgi:uncharacterized protein with FMN-binding domain